MQPARLRQEDFLLVEINNAKFTRPAVSSGEERGLLSRTAASNRAYTRDEVEGIIRQYSPSLRQIIVLV